MHDIEEDNSQCVPESWKSPKLVNSHQWMHCRVYPNESSILSSSLSDHFRYEGLYMPTNGLFVKLPEYMENPMYCEYLCVDGYCGKLIDFRPFSSDEDGNTQYFCKTHLPMSTEQCPHILLNGERCEKRCMVDFTKSMVYSMCVRHKKYISENNDSTCSFTGLFGNSCPLVSVPGTDFCHYHRIRKVRVCTWDGCNKSHKCKGELCAEHSREQRRLEKDKKEPGATKIPQRPKKGKEPKPAQTPISKVSPQGKSLMQSTEHFEIEGYRILEFTQNDDLVNVTFIKL